MEQSQLFPEEEVLRRQRAVRSTQQRRQAGGTAEQWIKEGKQAVKMTRLSWGVLGARFRSNKARLWLSPIACDLGNPWRRPALPKKIENWPPTSLQRRLAKTGGRLIEHARHYWLLVAESHPTRRLFGAMAERFAALPAPTG